MKSLGLVICATHAVVCTSLPGCQHPCVHIAHRLLKEPDAAVDAAAAAADEEAADDDDEEIFGDAVLVAERTVDRQILDAILQAGA